MTIKRFDCDVIGGNANGKWVRYDDHYDRMGHAADKLAGAQRIAQEEIRRLNIEHDELRAAAKRYAALFDAGGRFAPKEFWTGQPQAFIDADLDGQQ